MGKLKEFNKTAALVFSLAFHDIRARCLGSFLGFAWAFIQPFVLTVILWLVVGVAFKAGAVRGVAFLPWLLAGMSAWSFFSDALNQSTNVICEYAFLVRKVNFRLHLLPLMKILAALAVHLVFLLIVAVVLLLCGVKFSPGWLAVAYYILASCFLLAGLSYLTASLQVFSRDVGQIVSVALQFGFWVTPVFWDFTMLPAGSLLAKVLRLNPAVYIVEGYRNSLVFANPFTGGLGEALYFWGFALAVFLAGAALFRKLRPQFADVL
ncbi:MAG: ABC transporter permease [Kiritimatiellia bacterium]